MYAYSSVSADKWGGLWSFSNSQWERGRGKRIHLKLSKHQPRNSLGTPNARQTTSVRRGAVSWAPLLLMSLAQALVTLSQRSSIYQSLFFYLNSSHGSRGKWKCHRLSSTGICHQRTEPFEQLLLGSSRGKNKCSSQKIFNRMGWVTRLRGEMKDGNLKNSALNRKKINHSHFKIHTR